MKQSQVSSDRDRANDSAKTLRGRPTNREPELLCSHSAHEPIPEVFMQGKVREGRMAALQMLLMIAGGCVDPDDARYASESSLEQKLALIHRGGYVGGDDPLVSSFSGALDRLEAKCPEARQQLADMGVRGQELMSEKGVAEPLLGVFENWRAAIPDEVEDGGVGRCADILAVYITLRVGG